MTNLPRVSFCIPTLNSENTLDNCLRSIANQEYPDVEIVIVDGFSEDRTVGIARKYTDKIYFEKGKLGSARQTSIERSTGRILGLFDSDIVIPHKKWLINAVRFFNYGPRVGTVWPMYVAPIRARWTTRLYMNHYRLIVGNRISKRYGLFGGGNSLFLRSAFEEIGGVNRNIHWGEDFDWAMRLKDKGYQVVFINDPLYHDTMRTFRELVSKQFIGAEAFAGTRFKTMDIPIADVLYEQIVLGIKGMARGICLERDPSWLLFPIYLIAKMLAYSWTSLIETSAGRRDSRVFEQQLTTSPHGIQGKRDDVGEEKPKTIGLACSNGGHLTSMMQLSEAWRGRDVFVVTYSGPRKPTSLGRVYYIDEIMINPIRLVTGAMNILRILAEEKPSVVISTGAEIALPALTLSKLVGAKTVFVESISRSRDLSLTGKLLLGKVDHFLVQWPELKSKYGNEVEYRGRLL